MEKHTIHIKSLTKLFQILDGSFPSGSFVHSFGLEPHIISQKVTNIKELKKFLINLLKYQYAHCDLIFARKVFQYLNQNNLQLLQKEDNKYSAFLSYQYARASQEIGENYLKQIDLQVEKHIVKEYFKLVKMRKSFGNELAILSAYAYELCIDETLFLALWTKKNLLNIAMASLKISRIKPSEIQNMMFELDKEIEQLIINFSLEYNLFNPLFEETIYQHKILEPKLFVT